MNQFRFVKEYLLPIVIGLIGALFLYFYFSLSFYNRLSSEEFFFLNLLDTQGGIYNSVRYVCSNWSARWSGLLYFYLLWGKATNFLDINWIIVLHHSFTLLVLISSVYSLQKKVIAKIGVVAPNAFWQVCLAVLSTMIIFFAAPQLTDNWFWISSSVFHLQSFVIALFAISLVFNEKSNLLTYLLLVVSGIYIAGASELTAILLIGSTSTFFVYSKIVKSSFVKLPFVMQKKMLVLYLLIGAGLGISLAATGNQERLLSQPTLVDVVEPQSLAGIPIYFSEKNYTTLIDVLFTSKNCIVLVSFLLFLLLIPRVFQVKQSAHSIFVLKQLQRKLLVLLVISMAITFILNYFIFTKTLGPIRTWLLPSFLVVAFIWITLLKLGLQNERMAQVSIYALLPMCCILWIGLFSYAKKHVPLAKNYANSYDALLAQFCRSNDTKSTAKIELPNSGLLPYTPLTQEFVKQYHLCK
ncbi:MAG: hypothetical protein J0M08_00895 [Bacteroidetes bacterium]|nr:hypothetical protein [Bacteroidota bacterium]